MGKADRPLPRWDIHTHCLPGMDDGAEDAAVSLRMLRALAEQGIRDVGLTSHFYPQNETAAKFLSRRGRALAVLEEALSGQSGLPRRHTGAEIYLTQGLSSQDLRPLCIGATRLLLLELPRQPYKPWMLEEIQNITYALNIVPVMAHIERYRRWYDDKDYERLFDFEELVFQCNADSLRERENRHFLYTLVRRGLPLLMASDCHNTGDRAPRLAAATCLLEQKRKGRVLLDAFCQNENDWVV